MNDSGSNFHIYIVTQVESLIHLLGVVSFPILYRFMNRVGVCSLYKEGGLNSLIKHTS